MYEHGIVEDPSLKSFVVNPASFTACRAQDSRLFLMTEGQESAVSFFFAQIIQWLLS